MFTVFNRNTLLIALCALLTLPAVFLYGRTPPSAEAFGRSGGAEAPIYSASTERKAVSITFDAVWSDKDTEELLRLLGEHGVLATFFLSGQWIEQHPETAAKIRDGGHEIGNHSHTHAHSAALTPEQNHAEILNAHEKARQLLGVEMKLYRPPFGEYSAKSLKAAQALGYKTVMWSLDSGDLKSPGKDALIDNVLKSQSLEPGAIILFHNDAKYTVGAIEQIIIGLKEAGYEILKVSDIIEG